jgi:hypothetical protein
MLTDAPVSLLRRSPATMQPGCPSRASDLANSWLSVPGIRPGNRSQQSSRACLNHMREPYGTAGARTMRHGRGVRAQKRPPSAGKRKTPGGGADCGGEREGVLFIGT